MFVVMCCWDVMVMFFFVGGDYGFYVGGGLFNVFVYRVIDVCVFVVVFDKR